MSRTKVFLTGGDNIGWALDDDLHLTRKALEGTVDFTEFDQCDVVHSVWWEGLLNLPREQLKNKRVICHVPNRPFHYLKQPAHRYAMEVVGCWIVRATEALRELSSIGIESSLVPYTIDEGIFQHIAAEDERLTAMRRQWGIPADSYLIGNFHRDSEGKDLYKPKIQKGPDIFAEIVAELHRRGKPIHVVLAGPRRFWLRRYLDEKGVPYTFVGEVGDGGDDITINILPRSTLNVLYNLLDLYLITSRWEGGPQSIMEAALAQCKVISTRVGLAEDILQKECIYSNPLEAVDIIEKDIQQGSLNSTIAAHYTKMRTNHSSIAIREAFGNLYEQIESIPFYVPKTSTEKTSHPWLISSVQKLWRKISCCFTQHRMSVSFWHKFYKPPYGGGNQFMLALRKTLEQNGVKVRVNSLSSRIDLHLLNSVHFDIDAFRSRMQKKRIRIVHRIDGPIYLYRGTGDELDRLCFELNREFALATVIQSTWTYQRIVEMGYHPVNPVIIHNSVDPEIFYRRNRIDFDPCRKIRLISSSWSDNVRKGGPIYKWIDKNLDWNRFEYTFVGNASESFSRIRQVAPVPSAELANLLRQHDIYITASSNDPCSNAVIEALACGLPVLYFDDGGHPELVGYGGLPFTSEDEILSQLDKLVDNYEMFQNLIVVPTMEEVSAKYLQLLKEIAGYV